MSVVVDCSVAVAWYLPDESSAAAEQILGRVSNGGGVAPFLFRAEFANSLIAAERRKRIPEGFHRKAFSELESLQMFFDSEGLDHVWSTTSQMARRHGLTVYDAAYLELAQRLRLPLATLDRALTRAAAGEGVALAGNAGGDAR